MGVKTTYNCDICRDTKQVHQLLACIFKGMKDFSLYQAEYHREHQGMHICRSCAEQIKNNLLNDTDLMVERAD